MIISVISFIALFYFSYKFKIKPFLTLLIASFLSGIFLKIEPFAEYGFNKSHAAAYGIISYQTAFLKTYYPKEFIASSMSMDISNQNKLSEFYEELKRLNVEITRPDINECYADFRTNDKKFYYALGGIKAVGYEAITNIVN